MSDVLKPRLSLSEEEAPDYAIRAKLLGRNDYLELLCKDFVHSRRKWVVHRVKWHRLPDGSSALLCAGIPVEPVQGRFCVYEFLSKERLKEPGEVDVFREYERIKLQVGAVNLPDDRSLLEAVLAEGGARVLLEECAVIDVEDVMSRFVGQDGYALFREVSRVIPGYILDRAERDGRIKWCWYDVRRGVEVGGAGGPTVFKAYRQEDIKAFLEWWGRWLLCGSKASWLFSEVFGKTPPRKYYDIVR